MDPQMGCWGRSRSWVLGSGSHQCQFCVIMEQDGDLRPESWKNIYAFMHASMLQTFIEYLLHVRHYSRPWEPKREQKRNGACSLGAHRPKEMFLRTLGRDKC